MREGTRICRGRPARAVRYQQLTAFAVMLAAPAAKYLHGAYLVPFVALTGLVIGAQALVALAGRVTLGDDGVFVSFLGRKKWIAARRIARVRTDKQFVVFEMRDGTTEKLHFSKGDDMAAIVRRFTTASDDACDPSLAPLAVELDARMRARLDGTTPIRAQAYRNAASDEAQLAAILASPLVTPLARAGAALELGTSTARLAEAREHVAHPALGALLDALAKGADGVAAWRAIEGIPAEEGEAVASAPEPARREMQVVVTKHAGDAFEQRGFRVMPNVALHVLAAPTRYTALVALPIALATGIHNVMFATIMLASIGRLPWVFVRERNPGKKEKAAHVAVRERVVYVDGEPVCDASEIVQGHIHHAPGEKPTVRLVRRGVRFPIELRFEREESSRDFLASLGFDAGQAPATFTTLIPKNGAAAGLKWFGIPLLLGMATIALSMKLHVDMMTSSVAAMSFMFFAMYVERRIIVRTDGIEVRTPLSRKRFIPFTDVVRVERTKNAGTLHLTDGTTFPLRALVNDPPCDDRTDVLVERVIDAWHASREERVRVEESGTFVRIGEEEEAEDVEAPRCASVRR